MGLIKIEYKFITPKHVDCNQYALMRCAHDSGMWRRVGDKQDSVNCTTPANRTDEEE